MRILWTRGTSPASKAICGVTGEDVSHVAIHVKVKDLDLVFHSNFLGLHVELLSTFKRHSKIIYALEMEDIPSDLKYLYDTFSKEAGAFYDFGALFFIGFSLLARHYLKVPLPKSNLWQSTGMYICTEWVERIAWRYPDCDMSMYTPKQLYYVFLGHGAWQSVDVSEYN